MRPLLALALTFLLGVSVPAYAWAPSAPAMRALAGGGAWAEALPDGEGALIHAVIDIPAPPRVVWQVMTDCRLAKRLVATTTSCKVLAGDAHDGWEVREQVTHGNLIMPAIHNVIRADYQPYTLIRFRKAGGNLRNEDGEWRLEPLDGGAATRVIYVNRVGVDLFVPASLVRAGLRRDTPKVLLNLRRESLALARRQS